MKYFVERLDRRHTGHWAWKYRLRIQNDPGTIRTHYTSFHLLRAWMIETFGLSTERDDYGLILADLNNFSTPWCWHIDKESNTRYIYVANDPTLTHIQLRWSA